MIVNTQKRTKYKNRSRRLQNRVFSLSYYLVFRSLISLNAQENLKRMEPLMGKTWSAEGNWGDGSKFKQEITFSYGLDSTLVIANSKGYTNKKQTKYGHRNHGIRKYDAASDSYKFWEFDVFGGVTQGSMIFEEKNMFYQYVYGKDTITDAWEYVDPNTYNFKVGRYENGMWKQVYLETQFQSKAH